MADETVSLLPDPGLAREPGARSALQLVHRTETDLLSSFSGEPLVWGNNRFSVPLQQDTWQLDSRRTLQVNALTIEWQHNLNANNSMTLRARYGDSLNSTAGSIVGTGSAASLSWSKLFGGDARLIGRLYAGDEDARERSAGNNDRRYYGLLVEGHYSLWRDHAPFASLKWQRGNSEAYGSALLAGPLLRREQYSLLGAGWNWQVNPGWDVRAEANYRIDDDSADYSEADRTQLYFSTRYGFR